MRIRQMNSCLLKTKRRNVQKGLEKVQKVRFLSFRERERELILSRFSAVWTVGSRRS